ncbi:MAG: NAD-dependent epimerase/dehydratase family protein [Candidatus Bathyarchaeota archaeon]|nr:MAG: NAD-dependent epimerase/dehydratase family protein [Candidatus Bathyarchaeota archaeon]
MILVTGGSGFIGSHLVDELIEQGYGVRVFDRMKPLREDVEWFQGDLKKDEDLLLACKDVEAIFHLAAVADVNLAVSYPETCLDINENYTVKLLKAAVSNEVERILLASTTWVYGKTNGKVDEDSSIPMPGHVYTKSKIGQEHLVYGWHESYGLDYTILRYGIPYGPRMRSNMAIATFVRKASRSEPITIFGDGNQGRCFVYVEDLAEGNVAAMQEGGKNQIFNLAGEEFVTINQIVENLKQIFGEIDARYDCSRLNDFKGVVVDIQKAKNLLGWKPKTRLAVGLRKYVESIKQ